MTQHFPKPKRNARLDAGSRAIAQTLYLDLTDLIEYAKHNGTLSGIQRVVSGLLTYAQAWAEGQLACTIVPVVPEYDRYRVLAVDLGKVVEMIRLIEEHRGERREIDAAIAAVYESRIEIQPRKGDVFVIAGAFWIYPHYDLIIRLRERGVVFGLFIHDLIQIRNPEFVHKDATRVFRRSLVDALGVADFVLTNSHFVKDEVEAFMKERLGFTLPVAAVPLATELRLKTADAPLPLEVCDILDSDYVLCVGTIEVRKNHLLLVEIWERLVDELGEAAPDLVFVGKWGWDIEPLRARLEATQFLQGRVRVLANASDAALVELYRHCLMTAYVSFAEGFGLPVGESLAYGKPCVASRATSLPEVGGRFARYIDPNDPEEGARLFRALLTNRDEIERWRADIRAHYAPKSWRDFAFELLDACRLLGDARSDGGRLPFGATYALGDEALQRAEAARRSLAGLRMARDSRWHPIEPWGCWSSAREASLQFHADLPEGGAFAVSLLLQAPPGTERAWVIVRINDGTPSRFALYRSASWCLIPGAIAGRNGHVHIAFQCEGEFGRPDARFLYLGLQALDLVGDARALGALRLRAWLTRSKAVVRWAAARAPGRRLVSRERRADQLRRMVREELDQKLTEITPHASPAAAVLQVTNPFGPSPAAVTLALPAPGVLTTPAHHYMTAANCLARDFYAEAFAAFCARIGRPIDLHRRLWEYAFIAHHLETRRALVVRASGLALTTDDDPLVDAFSAAGCEVVREGVGSSGEGAHDFLWCTGLSVAASSEAAGLIERRLKPGGVAVFTGDFNLSADSRPTSEALTRTDIEQLTVALTAAGHRVERLPLEFGMTPLDAFVEAPPLLGGVRLKSIKGDVLVTSFGMVVVSGAPSADVRPPPSIERNQEILSPIEGEGAR